MSGLPFCSLNGNGVVRARLVLPAVGLWHADLMLEGVVLAPGRQTLILAGTKWVGTVIRSVTFAGVLSLRMVGGGGGWRKSVTARQYDSPIGVATAAVLGDVALLVGEAPPILAPTIPPTLGTGWMRTAGLARESLDLILGDNWWMDGVGLIQTVPRPPTPVASPFQVMAVQGAPGIYDIRTDTPADWMPGVAFASPLVSGRVSRVMHEVESGAFRTEVMAA